MKRRQQPIAHGHIRIADNLLRMVELRSCNSSGYVEADAAGARAQTLNEIEGA